MKQSSSSDFSQILNWGFRRYVRRFVRKNFNAVRVAGREHAEQCPSGPVVCFINHPGWWDPMTGVLITDHLFPGRRFTAPMDAEALSRYPVLEQLGFFPVVRDSASGAREFLRTCREMLKSADVILWLTPAGRFCDVRQVAPFMSGLSQLVDRSFTGSLLPMAIEYTFWNERCPELLVQFGEPIVCGELPEARDQRTQVLESCLGRTQSALAQLAIARQPNAFSTLGTGRAGIGGAYDSWRRLAAWIRGRQFRERHEEQQTYSASVARSDST